MANINVKLKNAAGDILYPKTTWNNIENKPSLYAHYITGIYDKGDSSQGHANNEITLYIISSQSTPVTNSNILASLMVTNAHYLATGTVSVVIASTRTHFSFIYKNSANELRVGTYTTNSGYEGDQLQPYFHNWQWKDIVVQLF